MRAGCGGALIGLQFLELEFELLDLSVELLRLVAILLTPQLGNQELEVFDRYRVISQRVVTCNDHRLQGGDVIGK